MTKINVAEFFAGVGGFRLGLEMASGQYRVIWSNQWEPCARGQVASDVYVKKFGPEGHINRDISTVSIDEVPDHDMMVGGFPCQDYSVAGTLNRLSGLEGKTGALWWQIVRILKEKKHRPRLLFFENVDRLLKSPAVQRGRDFAVILASLADLGYIVAWRIINAADYGMPQRRRRIFLLGYHKDSRFYKQIMKMQNPVKWIAEEGIFAEAFPLRVTETLKPDVFDMVGSLSHLFATFNRGADRGLLSPFRNSGLIIGRKLFTIDAKPRYEGPYETLGDKVLLGDAVPPEYYIAPHELGRWVYLKGAKKEKRIDRATGFEYQYSEGAVGFPDSLEKPSRTIITGEGGRAPSRFKHVIETGDGRLRRLHPVELERLNMFPDYHTEGISDGKRAFLMGNALVVGIVKKIGGALIRRIGSSNNW